MTLTSFDMIFSLIGIFIYRQNQKRKEKKRRQHIEDSCQINSAYIFPEQRRKKNWFKRIMNKV